MQEYTNNCPLEIRNNAKKAKHQKNCHHTKDPEDKTVLNNKTQEN